MAGKNVFRFKCGKCGKEAMTVKLGKKKLSIASPFSEATFPIWRKRIDGKSIAVVETALREKDLCALDGFFEIGCYCPECDKVYCSNHLKEKINFEADGWYDDAEFTCPKKHSRVVD